MARFIYRLQKVLDLRERKKKQQEQRVQDAQARVWEVEAAVQAKKNEIRESREHMMTGPAVLMKNYDAFVHQLNTQLDQLVMDLNEAKERLRYERQLLEKAQAELEAIVRHKENAQEAWREEEKRAEMKKLDEVGSQRYFRAQQEALEELELEGLPVDD